MNTPSVQLPIRALRDRGFDVVEVAPGADGRLDVQKLIDAVDKNTVLVACMAVNNETGAVQDIARLAAGVKAKNSRTAVHIDAVQAWLRIPLDLKKLPGVDTLAVSGHKVHAPKGIGALYLCENQRQHLRPPYLGGHQERGIRPGTENLPYAVGLGLAAEQGARRMRAAAANAAALNAQLRAGLAALPGVTLHSPAGAVPEVLNFSTNCVNSQTFISYLNDRRSTFRAAAPATRASPATRCRRWAATRAPSPPRCASASAPAMTRATSAALLAALKDGLPNCSTSHKPTPTLFLEELS